MTKKPVRLRPGVESLETMVLLSTAAAPLHPVAQPAALVSVEPAAKAAPVVALRGTIKGTGTFNGTSLTLQGSGNLGKVGPVTLRAGGSLLDPPSTVTLNTRRGKLILAAVDSPSILGTNGSSRYTITGGTKAYAGATGSGLVTGTYGIRGATGFTFRVRFS